MDLDHLTLLGDELVRFEACLDGDLSAPVAHCGDWTLRDLAEHLGQGNLWAAAAVTEGHGRHRAGPAPAELAPWLTETGRALLDVLAADPATAAWTFHPPHTVGFWRRRRLLETLVHRWDAEQALGRPSRMHPPVCGDGIAEVIEVMAPRQVRRGTATPPAAAVRFTATDLDTSWLLGPGAPVATLSGTAAELLLALWGRAPLPWHTLTGDEAAAREVLRGPLVP